jgi:hypothetical protein
MAVPFGDFQFGPSAHRGWIEDPASSAALAARIPSGTTGFFRPEVHEGFARAGGLVPSSEEHRCNSGRNGFSLQPDDESLPGAV